MKAVDWFMAHPTLWLACGWLFSAFCSTMPPLSDNAGYWTRWAHDFLQAVAANFNKRTASTTTIQTADASVHEVKTEGTTEIKANA